MNEKGAGDGHLKKNKNDIGPNVCESPLDVFLKECLMNTGLRAK